MKAIRLSENWVDEKIKVDEQYRLRNRTRISCLRIQTRISMNVE